MRRNTHTHHHSNPIMPRPAEAEDAVEAREEDEEDEEVKPVNLLSYRDIEQHY